MADSPGTVALKCQLIAGLILRRSCQEATTFTCARCRRAACEKHIRHLKSAVGTTADVCTECMPRSASTNSTRTSDSFNVFGGTYIDSSGPITGSSASSEPSNWTDNAGGSFGGGGASGGWGDPLPDAAAGAPDAAGFSPQDYAAFDALTESDKVEGTPGYDS